MVLGPVELGVFLAERTFHQVMPVFGVLKNLPPLSLSLESVVLDDSTYMMGSFNAYVDTSRDYATWFTESSKEPIIGDVPMSRGRVLGCIVRAQVASKVE